MDKFDAINRDLQTLRNSKKALRLFGAAAHGYRMNAPLSEGELAAFETKHGVALPEDYREFLLRVGNGGAGPYYGVFKLGEMDDGFGFGPWGDFVGDLSKPFPHTEAWNDLTGAPPDFVGAEDSPEEEEYYRQMDEFQEKYFSGGIMNGAIPICHMGCALRLWLIVTGPEKGNIWEDNRADEAGIKPLHTATQQRVTFYEWYRAWLDEALKKS
jgi:hypothetical protein